MNTAIRDKLALYKTRFEPQLNHLFDNIDEWQTPLIASMKYSLLNGGKRVRPMLVYAAAEACGEVNEVTDHFACAVECIHVYSLIHDDLPAMDDDELRRGKPTNHIAFDEATAILAGDALLSLAFELISKAPADAALIVQACRQLAIASGMQGMVMGQAIDLHAVSTTPDLQLLEQMHLHKTGALIKASIQLGAISTNANAQQQAALQQYAQAIGLAFQVQDDILDVTADTQTLGKAQGADAKHNKPTYVSLLGLENAQQKANHLCKEAHAALQPFHDKATLLADLASYIVQRRF